MKFTLIRRAKKEKKWKLPKEISQKINNDFPGADVWGRFWGRRSPRTVPSSPPFLSEAGDGWGRSAGNRTLLSCLWGNLEPEFCLWARLNLVLYKPRLTWWETTWGFEFVRWSQNCQNLNEIFHISENFE